MSKVKDFMLNMQWGLKRRLEGDRGFLGFMMIFASVFVIGATIAMAIGRYAAYFIPIITFIIIRYYGRNN